MTVNKRERKKNIAYAAAILVPALLVTMPTHAEDFTAGLVMREYDASERALFLGGLIEGLAQARYERDGKDPAGAKCIYDWFYAGGEDTLRQIYGAFAAHSNSAPAAVVSALVNQECNV